MIAMMLPALAARVTLTISMTNFGVYLFSSIFCSGGCQRRIPSVQAKERPNPASKTKARGE
jgi:hypothetical protein